jgi:hypothetical protein
MQYRYIEHRNRHNQHRFVFNINPGVTGRNQQPVGKHHDRSREPAAEYPRPVQQAIANQSEQFQNDIQTLITEKLSEQRSKYILGDDRFWTADSFNRFISGLSNQYKSEDHRSTARSHSTEHTTNFKSNQNLESITEISNADRNRPFFERAKRLIESTKQLVSRAKQSIESTSEFIKKHLEQIQRSRAELTKQNQQLEKRERNPAGLDFSTETELSKLEQGNFSEQLQQAFQNNVLIQLQTQLTQALNQLDLNSIVSNLVKQH